MPINHKRYPNIVQSPAAETIITFANHSTIGIHCSREVFVPLQSSDLLINTHMSHCERHTNIPVQTTAL
jgi:hypothetical protein